MPLMAAIQHAEDDMKFIDPHVHFFDRAKGEYHWLCADHPPWWPDKALIARDFSPEDILSKLPKHMTCLGFVHIEAGFDNAQPWREIAWLESTIIQPFRSIACIDLTIAPSEFEKQLSTLTTFQSVVGVRHILNEVCDVILNAPNTQKNLALLETYGLIFEAQFDANCNNSSEAIITCFSRFPRLCLVLNHGGFPPASAGLTWQENMRKLSKLSQVNVKVSGWEMTDRAFALKWIETHLQTLLGIFSTSRLMMASNFPLCLFQLSYADFWQRYESLPLNSKIRNALFFENAQRIYQLKTPE